MPSDGSSPRNLLGRVDEGLAVFYLVCTLVLGFVIAPIVTIFGYSILGTVGGSFGDLITAEHYANALSNNWEPLLLSLQVAVITTIADIFVGVPAGYALVKYDFRFSDLLRELTILPMAIPGIVIGIGIVRVWGVPHFGIDLSGTTAIIVLVHVLFTTPFILQTTMSTLESIEFRKLEESARTLGAGWPETFRYVILPNIANGVLSGAIMVFALSMGEFNITFFVYSPLNTTLPIALFGGFRTATVGEASALASLFIGIVILSLVVLQSTSGERLRQAGGNI